MVRNGYELFPSERLWARICPNLKPVAQGKALEVWGVWGEIVKLGCVPPKFLASASTRT